MYSPTLTNKAIKTIYRLKQVYKLPMTIILDNFIQNALELVDRFPVCEKCIEEKNDDCNECYLKKGDNK